MSAIEVKTELRKHSSKDKAKFLSRYFKTGKGEYAEGDVFLGMTVPQIRSIATTFKDLELSEVQKLLQSKVHEERLAALMILSLRAISATEEQKTICNFYLLNTKYVNNWDLVDSSAEYIIGRYLYGNPDCATIFKGATFQGTKLLEQLAKSEYLWERRIAIISTSEFIKHNKFNEALKIAKLLLGDKHDLIHKAVGWMLREVGKRDQTILEKFLKDNYSKLPRTTLRYAIERFSQKKKFYYLYLPKQKSS